MKPHLLILLLLLFVSLVSGQEQLPMEVLEAPRLIEPAAGEELDPASFPVYISPLDTALTIGSFLFHFTGAQFAPSNTGPDIVILILEGYIANYSDHAQELFDTDFVLTTTNTEIIADTELMAAYQISSENN